MYKLFSITALFLTSTTALANWTGMGKVEEVYSHNGFHVISTDINSNTCGTSGKFYWSATDEDAKDMLAIALAALMSQKQVRVYFNQASPNCRWGAETATHIMIRR